MIVYCGKCDLAPVDADARDFTDAFDVLVDHRPLCVECLAAADVWTPLLRVDTEQVLGEARIGDTVTVTGRVCALVWDFDRYGERGPLRHFDVAPTEIVFDRAGGGGGK